MKSLISARLKDELDAARAEYDLATVFFTTVVRDLPSSIPVLDSTLRIKQSGKASRLALERYVAALRRFSEYTLNGKIPDDLRPTG